VNRIGTIREKLIDPALVDLDVPALERACAILQVVAEAEKIETDISTKVRASHSEYLRFWIPILAPTITAIALVSTLVFQIQQYQANTALQNQANEDTQWRTAVTYAASDEGKQSVLAFTLLKSFFDSKRYSKQAREAAEVLIADTPYPISFRNNFEDLLTRTNWDNFQSLVNISRMLVRFYENEDREIRELKEHPGQPTVRPGSHNHYSAKAVLEENIIIASKGLVKFLREHPRPSGITLDLNDSAIRNQDLSNMDFGGALLTFIWINNCNLEGADFRGATIGNEAFTYSNVKGADFSGVKVDTGLASGKPNWEGTAWWQAKRVSPDLLKYLQSTFKFPNKADNLIDNREGYLEYQRELERLTRNQ
jgi:hypothetical protein